MSNENENTPKENTSGNASENSVENTEKNKVVFHETKEKQEVQDDNKDISDDEKTDEKTNGKGFIEGDPLRSDDDDDDDDDPNDPNFVLLDDDGDADEEEEDDSDGGGSEKEPKKPLGDILDDDGIPDFKVILRDFGMTGLDLLEEVLCNMNMAIGGGHKADYAINTKVKKAFFDSSLQLMRQKEVAPPTPMQLFLLALGAMVLPGLGKAVFRRFTRPAPVLAAQKQPNAHTEQAMPQQEYAKPPETYTDTPEFMQHRTKFMVFGETGCYQYRWFEEKNKFEYVKQALADEKPSEKIQKLIDEGKDNTEIKKILYGV